MKSLMNLFRVIGRFLSQLFYKKRAPHVETETIKPKPLPLPAPSTTKTGEPPWLQVARSLDGTKEIRGSKHNPDILKFSRDIGLDFKTDEIAWCATFLGSCLETSGHPSTKSAVAKSYITWGKVLSKPKLGCIAIFDRPGGPKWQGHVGFYIGEDKTNVFVLGGNQRNAVNVSKYPKSRLVGYRWPVTPANSRTVTASSIGTIGAAFAVLGEIGPEAAAQLGDAAMPMANELKSLAEYFAILGVVGGVVALLSYAIVFYARWDDLRKKGR